MRMRTAAVDEPESIELLDEYFTSRELGFTGGVYKVVRPAPSLFVPPAGEFLLAYDDDALAGCGGVRRIDDDADGAIRYEVKHLYLRPGVRGRGWGRTLLAELEGRAALLGARRVVLDTNATLTAAGGLYRSAGYRSVEPYNDNPNATHWFAKDL